MAKYEIKDYYKFKIPERLIGFNDFLREINKNRKAGNRIKQEIEQLIICYVRNQMKNVRINYPVNIKFTWIEFDRKRDKDNIAFAKKFIQDALVKNDTIENDGWKQIVGFQDVFVVDKSEAGVLVELFRAGDNFKPVKKRKKRGK